MKEKSFLLDSAFWAAAGERCVKTIAQTAIALIPTSLVAFHEIDWLMLASTAGVAGVVSLLTSIASGAVGNDGPSLANETLE